MCAGKAGKSEGESKGDSAGEEDVNGSAEGGMWGAGSERKG